MRIDVVFVSGWLNLNVKLIRPVFMSIPKDENEAVRTAVESIIRILKAAGNANIKHAVMESIC